MSEYIERESLISNLKDLPEQEHIEYMGIYDCIKSQHTANVVEIRHGKWLTADIVEIRHGKWLETQEPLGWCDVDCIECSVCHESWIMDEDSSIDDYKCMWHYCPNCGAKMDGDTK